ncbi:MAG: carboxypeptidase regulatory-like domain-containing protein [Leptolyngbyaceae cyanobacterium SM2_5_2]|nr:carboxypeptidase regulatory-like domain-containing protein [Leptolyngbyaceae cyanobacterium SM2_5_2]
MAWATPGLSHGVSIQHQTVSSVEIQASFDSGEPMKEAQVVVYAPDNPTEPWMKGTTDAEGRFVFTPDAAQPGNWEVAVRQAGHGEILSIPVGAELASADPSSPALGQSVSTSSAPELSPVQRWITIGAVIWGFIGTALFFSRGKR